MIKDIHDFLGGRGGVALTGHSLSAANYAAYATAHVRIVLLMPVCS